MINISMAPFHKDGLFMQSRHALDHSPQCSGGNQNKHLYKTNKQLQQKHDTHTHTRINNPHFLIALLKVVCVFCLAPLGVVVHISSHGM